MAVQDRRYLIDFNHSVVAYISCQIISHWYYISTQKIPHRNYIFVCAGYCISSF